MEKEMKKNPYINGDPKRGLLYDWKKIRAEYKKLGCPVEYFDPTLRPIDKVKYLTVFSRRATGKTTNVLLLGMVMNKLYGTTIVYVRQVEDMIAPKNCGDMFSVIQNLDYIYKLTDGRWNGVKLYRRRWYYCNYDEDGREVERADTHFCFMCDIVQANNLKSSFADVNADYIVYDEFVNGDGEKKSCLPDEFVKFCDLISTVVRQRFSPIVWLLSNNTDKESPYFYEMECNDIVRALGKGESKSYTTERGTDCYVEWYSPEVQHNKSRGILDRMNELFFGFKNKKLGSITGEDWAIKPVQHIPRDEVDFLIQNVYIFSHNKYVKLDFVYHKVLGVCCYCHWATKVYEDSYIFTIEDRFDPRYHYGLGTGRFAKLFQKCILENRFYYASDDIYALMKNHISSIPSGF